MDDYIAHAEFHARENPTGIGAAVVQSSFDDGERVWDCIVTDGHEWHYIRVIGRGLGPFPNISSDYVEEGVMRFAATLPAQNRLRHLLDADPLHIDSTRKVGD